MKLLLILTLIGDTPVGVLRLARIFDFTAEQGPRRATVCGSSICSLPTRCKAWPCTSPATGCFSTSSFWRTRATEPLQRSGDSV